MGNALTERTSHLSLQKLRLEAFIWDFFFHMVYSKIHIIFH